MPPGAALYGLDPEASLAAAISHIAAHQGDANCLVLTGDMTVIYSCPFTYDGPAIDHSAGADTALA